MSKKKIGIIFAGCVAGVLLTVYVSGMIYLQDKFFMNTTINGINASYCTVDEVEKRIEEEVKKYQIELEERGGDKETLKAAEIDYHYISNGEVQGFIETQKLATWPIALFRGDQFYFDHSTEYDQEKLKQRINKLNCFRDEVVVEPEDAKMKFGGLTYEMQPEKQGKKVKKKVLRKALTEAIEKGDTALSLEASNCYAKPKITQDDEELNKLIHNMNKYAKVKITYKFGEMEEVLDGSIIHKWLDYNEAGDVLLDEEKVALYVQYLADRYDSYGKAREFQTSDGSWVSVEGGKYGWLIDKEVETVELIDQIHKGRNNITREPVYAQAAVTRENSDLGHDYIEIDLTKQHLWMYVNGELVVESDFVSGTYYVSRRRTPPGTFTLYYKKSPSVLRSNYPGDSYETPVTFWMPFNGGVGLHDASWRGRFGGEIYLNSGSHGCINLPYSAAQEIYSLIYTGMPIICFYR